MTLKYSIFFILSLYAKLYPLYGQNYTFLYNNQRININQYVFNKARITDLSDSSVSYSRDGFIDCKIARVHFKDSLEFNQRKDIGKRIVGIKLAKIDSISKYFYYECFFEDSVQIFLYDLIFEYYDLQHPNGLKVRIESSEPYSLFMKSQAKNIESILLSDSSNHLYFYLYLNQYVQDSKDDKSYDFGYCKFMRIE